MRVQNIYLNERDNDGSPITGCYKAVMLKNRHYLLFTEEGMEIGRLRRYSKEIDMQESLTFFAHFFLVGNPEETIDVEKVANMTLIEFCEYLITLRKRKPIKCLFR